MRTYTCAFEAPAIKAIPRKAVLSSFFMIVPLSSCSRAAYAVAASADIAVSDCRSKLP
jgi:hypothetical protein